jgi:hypothetical protein
MKTREQIITDMCCAWRHDYGLDKEEGADGMVSGMTSKERQTLWNDMERIFDECIVPLFAIPDSRSLCDND